MTRPLEAWDRLVRSLVDEVPEAAFAAWLEPVVAEERDGDLHLRCPSAFHRERLRERFLARIEVGLDQSGASGARVRLSVDPGASSRRRRAEKSTPVPTQGARDAKDAEKTPDIAEPSPTIVALPPSSPPASPVSAPLAATFDSFVVGASNALAREAGFAVANGRQAAMSPLYLVAGPGLGKSHLASAIVSEARRVRSTRAVLVSAEQFTNELTRSIREKRTADFKFRYREDLDVLVVEDVEFLQGKRATQIELFHTLDSLTRRGRRVVLTATRNPREIPDLDPRLASRMSGGLCAEIEIPDHDHRRQILRSKAAAGGIRIPKACLELLADAPFQSVRDLEGTLVRFVANAALLNRPLDMSLAEAVLRKTGIAAPRLRAPMDIATEVAAFFGSSLEALASPSRRRDVTWPRQVAMYLCHRFTPASTQEIGALFGRGHSAARNAIQVVERAILERAPRRYQVESLIERMDPAQPGQPEVQRPGGAPGNSR